MATIDETLPVYIVEGANWTIEIQLDEDDAEMSLEDQRIEAATKACELVNGVVEPQYECNYEIKSGEAPYIGPVLLVHLKGTDPEKDLFEVHSYVPLANAGFYMDSLDIEKILIEELKAEQLRIDAQNKSDIENFEKLQQELKSGQISKKPNKKKRKKK